jgi:hypothetical protein
MPQVPATLVLLSTQTASASANISFTTGLDSTYDEYIFKFIDIHPATDAVDISLLMEVQMVVLIIMLPKHLLSF